DDGVYVFKVRATRRQAVVVDRAVRDPDGVRTTVSFNVAGQALFDIVLLDEVPYDAFVPQMLNDFELGDDQIRGPLRKMLEKVSKRGAGLDDEAALPAWRAWFEAHADEKMVQREGN
ncbi:MAG: hypothetical protein VX913_14110, partial [Planctomycetota bacterium]|nr:hypothetical protein [Planctomycetota bacterium]